MNKTFGKVDSGGETKSFGDYKQKNWIQCISKLQTEMFRNGQKRTRMHMRTTKAKISAFANFDEGLLCPLTESESGPEHEKKVLIFGIFIFMTKWIF